MRSFSFLLLLLFAACHNNDAPASKAAAAAAEKNVTDPRFEAFCLKFPAIQIPYSLNERESAQLDTSKLAALPVSEVETYICSPERSTFVCVEAPGASEASDESGFDVRNRFFPVGIYRTDTYIMLLYQLNLVQDRPVYLATYTPSGALRSRICFAGYKGDYAQLDGAIKTPNTVLTQLQDLSDTKTAPNPAVVNTTNRNYKIRPDGIIMYADKEVWDEAGQ